MRILFLLLCGSLLSCATTSQQTTETKRTDSVAVIVEPRIIFGFTSSGFGQRPSDAIRLDSTGQMTYITRSRISGENFSSLTGMAFLEDPDYSQLLSIVKRGNLTVFDSTDVGIKCPQGQGEMMSLVLRTTEMTRSVNLTFDECATDYNLLLEPQRTAFKDLINWFRAVRNKYRPAKP